MELKEIINHNVIIRTRANLSTRELSFSISKNASYIHLLESSKTTESSITVLNDIVDACNTSLEEFFYYDLTQYKQDKEVLTFLKNLSPNQKEAIMNLYKK